MNKKGSVDFIFLILIVWFVGLFLVISSGLWNMLKDDIEPDIRSKVPIMALDRFFGSFDYLFVFILLGLSIGLFATGFLLSSHPFFYIAFIPIFILVIYITPILANTYDSSVKDSAEFQEAEASYNVIPIVFKYFPTIILVIGVIFAVVLFGKSRSEGGFT